MSNFRPPPENGTVSVGEFLKFAEMKFRLNCELITPSQFISYLEDNVVSLSPVLMEFIGELAFLGFMEELLKPSDVPSVAVDPFAIDDKETFYYIRRYLEEFEGDFSNPEDHPWYTEYVSKFEPCPVEYGYLLEELSKDFLDFFQRLVYSSTSMDYRFEKGETAPAQLLLIVKNTDDLVVEKILHDLEYDTVLRTTAILLKEVITFQSMKMFDEDGTPEVIEEQRKKRLKKWNEKRKICEKLQLEWMMKNSS